MSFLAFSFIICIFSFVTKLLCGWQQFWVACIGRRGKLRQSLLLWLLRFSMRLQRVSFTSLRLSESWWETYTRAWGHSKWPKCFLWPSTSTFFNCHRRRRQLNWATKLNKKCCSCCCMLTDQRVDSNTSSSPSPVSLRLTLLPSFLPSSS